MRINEIVKWVSGPEVLDVGCTGHAESPTAPSWLHGKLRKQFGNVTGIDTSTKNVEELQRLGFADIHVQSAEAICFDKRFNTIVAGELIEHLSNPGNFLESARNHLARNGRLVITTPYPFSLAYSLYALKNFPVTCFNKQHTCWFCPSTLQELASRFGLKVVHWELIEDYTFDDPSRTYRTFSRIVTGLRWIIPYRLRCNHLLAVLQRVEEL